MVFHPLGYVAGVDVSLYQAKPDWLAVYTAGYRFAICKADEGASANDPTYVANREGAKSAGLLVGDYHFARPMAGADDAVREADHFLARIASRLTREDLPPTLDIEESQIEGASLVEWLWSFRERVRAATDRPTMIYTNPSYLLGKRARLDARFVSCPLWIAHWGVSAPGTLDPWPRGAWSVWQWGTAKVPGIGPICDANWFRGDEAGLRAWVAASRMAPADPCDPANADNFAADALCANDDEPPRSAA